uniref:DUF58 domain-containing protein n=1 Tax=Panagrellus redivivus TaxID=6233 RepID=A0A7E4WAX4_PANRE
MSLGFNDTAIKRFTYDWLIRFAELHPFETHDSVHTNWELLYTDDNPLTIYSSHCSKYAAISPMFTTLVARYMPYIFYAPSLTTESGVIKYDDVHKEHHALSKKKSKIYVCGTCDFTSLTPGMITSFMKNRVFFYGKKLRILSFKNSTKSCMTPDELRYLLKNHNVEREVSIDVVLTTPVSISEILPLVAHCKKIRFGIPNLVYGENIANVFHHNRVCPTSLDINHLKLSDTAVLEMFDYLLSLQVRPHTICMTFQHQKSEALAEEIKQKYRRAGLRKHIFTTETAPLFGFLQIVTVHNEFLLDYFDHRR